MSASARVRALERVPNRSTFDIHRVDIVFDISRVSLAYVFGAYPSEGYGSWTPSSRP